MLSRDEIEAVLQGGHELQALEVKGPGSATDIHLFAKVTRAAISMGNLRDGGHVIVGLDDSDLAAMAPGLTSDDLNTWMAFDEVCAKMANYSDPPLKLHIDAVELSNQATVAVVEVAEFVDLPHICIKQYEQVLQSGRIYVRTRKMPQTAPIGSAAEMRELLDLASEKRLRAYVETAERAGARLTPVEGQPSDAERFADERNRAWND
jgi:predicted HTH transcriptional regulator